MNGTSIYRRARCVIAVLPLAAVLIPLNASACLWTYGTDLHGIPTEYVKGSYDLKDVTLHGAEKDQWKQKRRELEAELQNSNDFRTRSDFAVVLLHLAETGRAIEILERVESDKPGEYIVAANLGTAYELAGKNAKALKWIKKGIERNADSHYGTEWLHVRILEAKIGLETDPTWLQNNSVLGLDFGRDPEPQRPRRGPTDNKGNRLSLEDTARAMEYQLHERLQFVPPPDAIVADLLFDLGNLIALTEAVEAAIPIYELAAEYAASPSDLLQQRTAHMQSIAAKNFLSGIPATGIGVLLTAVALVILAVSCFGLALYYRHRRARAHV